MVEDHWHCEVCEKTLAVDKVRCEGCGRAAFEENRPDRYQKKLDIAVYALMIISNARTGASKHAREALDKIADF